MNILLHLDGAQVWGKLVLNVIQTPADFITFSSHKIGAPAGTGLIWKRPTRKLIPLIQGSQAHGLRGGTENTLGIIATGFAAEKLDALEFQERTAPLQAILEKNLSSVKIWGKTAVRVTNTTRLSYSNFQAYENWVELLDVNGFAVSHGSACKSKVIEPSRILLAMGGTKAEALNSIRISFGVQNTLDDVYGVMAALQKIYDQKMQNTPEVRA